MIYFTLNVGLHISYYNRAIFFSYSCNRNRNIAIPWMTNDQNVNQMIKSYFNIYINIQKLLPAF